MKKIIRLTIFFSLFITLSSFSSFSGRKVPVKNKEASAFCLDALSGERIALADYQGKIVVLNFWANWCAPCLREMPNLERIHKKYHQRGVQVIGVAVVSNESDVPQKVIQTGVTYPILFGNKRLIAQYGSFSDLPTTFIIDEKGNILRQLSGSSDYKTLEQEIIPYLKDPSFTNR